MHKQIKKQRQNKEEFVIIFFYGHWSPKTNKDRAIERLQTQWNLKNEQWRKMKKSAGNKAIESEELITTE